MDVSFSDRREAGKRLGVALLAYKPCRPLVLGLARGGVVIAAAIARELETELDVLVARKVGAPGHEEFGIGAVAPDGTQVSDPFALIRMGISQQEFDRMADAQRLEVDRRLAAYRGTSEPPRAAGRTVIVTDDGLATGVTALAACRYVRSLNPVELVLAVPVCTRQARAILEPEVDNFVFLAQPEPFFAVGQWYEDFAQVDDREVLRELDLTRTRKGNLF